MNKPILAGIAILLLLTGFFCSMSDFVAVDSMLATPTVSPLVITVPPVQSDMPFVVRDSVIRYSARSTMDFPCNYIIEGRVLDLDGQPYLDADVYVQMLSDMAPERPSRAYDPGAEELGPSGWTMLLVNWEVAYEVWLVSATNGEQLSDRIYVPPRGCDNNVAFVEFVQVRPQ